MTVTEVRGYGRQKGRTEIYRGTEDQPDNNLAAAAEGHSVNAARRSGHLHVSCRISCGMGCSPALGDRQYRDLAIAHNANRDAAWKFATRPGARLTRS